MKIPEEDSKLEINICFFHKLNTVSFIILLHFPFSLGIDSLFDEVSDEVISLLLKSMLYM